MKLLLVDSYDSFTHNLAQALGSLGGDVSVVRSDQVSPTDVLAAGPCAVVLGPGPGRPEEAGCLIEAAKTLSGRVPLLGVCLGHQAIGLAFGGQVTRHVAVHGHATPIHHDGTTVFAGLPPAVPMTRYHSLVVDRDRVPAALRVTAWSDDGAIMGLAHRQHLTWGVQFHPESVLSGDLGLAVLRSFVGAAAHGGEQYVSRDLRPDARERA